MAAAGGKKESVSLSLFMKVVNDLDGHASLGKGGSG